MAGIRNSRSCRWRRVFSPSLEPLEPVRLLSSTADVYFISYSTSLVYSPGGAVYATVGEGMGIEVSDRALRTIDSVAYDIPGALTIGSSYTNQEGSAGRINGAFGPDYTHIFPVDNRPTNVGVYFYWDEHKGNRTVTVTINYTDGGQDVQTLQAIVEAPTVLFYQVSVSPLTFSPASDPFAGPDPNGTEWIGYIQPPDSEQFDASVMNTTHYSGSVGFIQTLDGYAKYTYSDGSTNDVAVAKCLDGGPPDPSYFYAAPAEVGPNNEADLHETDSPHDMEKVPAPGANEKYATKISVQMLFTTNLVFQVDGGLSIALSTAKWNQSGVATFNGQYPADYLKVNKWGQDNGTQPSPVSGDNTLKLLDWITDFQDEREAQLLPDEDEAARAVSFDVPWAPSGKRNRLSHTLAGMAQGDDQAPLFTAFDPIQVKLPSAWQLGLIESQVGLGLNPRPGKGSGADRIADRLMV